MQIFKINYGRKILLPGLKLLILMIGLVFLFLSVQLGVENFY